MEQSIQDKVQAQYGRQASFYSVSRTHASGNSLELLLEWAAPTGSERVLDVATGTGFCAMAFAPQVREVVAYDLTQEMLDEAARLSAERKLTNVTFQQGSAESMPFDDASFDIVTCRVAPHHFASVPRFCAESWRVLKPGGKLLIVDTASPANAEADEWVNHVEILRDPSHVRDYNEQEWRAFAADAGFKEIEVALTRWTRITFNDWVERSGTPAGTVSELRRLFSAASSAVLDVLGIQSVAPDDFSWEWPVVCLQATKL